MFVCEWMRLVTVCNYVYMFVPEHVIVCMCIFLTLIYSIVRSGAVPLLIVFTSVCVVLSVAYQCIQCGLPVRPYHSLTCNYLSA